MFGGEVNVFFLPALPLNYMRNENPEGTLRDAWSLDISFKSSLFLRFHSTFCIVSMGAVHGFGADRASGV